MDVKSSFSGSNQFTGESRYLTPLRVSGNVQDISESNLANVSKTASTNVLNQLSPKQKYTSNCGSMITSTNNFVRNEVIRENNINVVDAEEKNNRSKQARKRKTVSLTMEAVQKHTSKPIGEAAINLNVSQSTLKRFCHEHNMPHWPSTKLHNKKSDLIYQAAWLIVHLKRWRNKTIKHGMQKRDHPSVPAFETLAESTRVPASQEQKLLANLSSDTIRMVTVKATFNKDMIKFPFRTSLGLSELQNNVAQRISKTRIRLKYKDEDDDMILLACDSDLRELLRLSGGTIKLYIQLGDD